MGISRKAWEVSGGYRISVREDIEFSMRLIAHGLHSKLIPEAHVYHKRRTDFVQFKKQVRFFGTARVNIRKFFPGAIRAVHWMPTLFLGYLLAVLPLSLFLHVVMGWGALLSTLPAWPYVVWHLALFIGGWVDTRSLRVARLVPRAGRIQLTSYGWGLLSEYTAVVLLGRRDPTIGEVLDVPACPV